MQNRQIMESEKKQTFLLLLFCVVEMCVCVYVKGFLSRRLLSIFPFFCILSRITIIVCEWARSRLYLYLHKNLFTTSFFRLPFFFSSLCDWYTVFFVYDFL